MANKSVERFGRQMRDIRKEMGISVHETMLKIANQIADEMKLKAEANAELGTGALAGSVKVIDDTPGVGRLAEKKNVSVRIVAGGQATTKTGKYSYDHSLAVEFGTQKMAAEPFFYTTFRRFRNASIRKVAETVEEAIKNNQKTLDQGFDPEPR